MKFLSPFSPCPHCGQRSLRRARLGRVACTATGCNWHGPLLPSGPPGAAAPARRAWRWLLAAAVVIGVPAAVVLAGGPGQRFERNALDSLPPGASHDGRALPAGHPLQTWMPVAERAGGRAAGNTDEPLLTLRSHCAWGEPGRNPYQGSTEQALRMARLPPEVVREIAAMRREGRRTDRVEIRNSGITTVSDQRWFNPRSFAMTFGRTLCVDARVNFALGHVEQGDLFEARDAQGRLHSVMVPDVCGNVSVLGGQGGRMGQAQLLAAMAAQGGPRPMEMPAALEGLWAALAGGVAAVADEGADRAIDGRAAVLSGRQGVGFGAAGSGMSGHTGSTAGVPGVTDTPVLRVASAGPVQPQPGSRLVAAAPSPSADALAPAQPTGAAAPGTGPAAAGALPGSFPSGGSSEQGRAGDGGGGGSGAWPAAPIPAVVTGPAAAVNQVPEPGTVALVLGALGVLWWRRRRP